MKFWKRAREGWYSIDNTASGGKLVERPVATCAHCQWQIIIQPLRTRDRFECPRCDYYICDACEIKYRQTDYCDNFQRQLDEREKEIRKELSSNVTVDPRIIKP